MMPSLMVSTISYPVFARIHWWLSQFSSVYFASPPPLEPGRPSEPLTQYTLRHAFLRPAMRWQVLVCWMDVRGMTAWMGRSAFFSMGLVGHSGLMLSSMLSHSLLLLSPLPVRVQVCMRDVVSLYAVGTALACPGCISVFACWGVLREGH